MLISALHTRSAQPCACGDVPGKSLRLPCVAPPGQAGIRRLPPVRQCSRAPLPTNDAQDPVLDLIEKLISAIQHPGGPSTNIDASCKIRSRTVRIANEGLDYSCKWEAKVKSLFFVAAVLPCSATKIPRCSPTPVGHVRTARDVAHPPRPRPPTEPCSSTLLAPSPSAPLHHPAPGPASCPRRPQAGPTRRGVHPRCHTAVW